jgi:methionyl-tRNA formyltransferase
VNLHFSVLPAWRGAAPVQHAILRGDDITGASTFLIVRELDAGPVFGTLTEPIGPADTSGDLLDRLALTGARLLVDTLDAIEDGTVRAVPQPADGVSFAPKLTPADARVDWKLPAHLIGRQIRACTPDPGAWTEFTIGQSDRARLKLWPVTPAAGAGLISGADRASRDHGLAPGELRTDRNAVYAGTGTIPVRLGDVQPQGKRRMPAADWARGIHRADGVRPSVPGLRLDLPSGPKLRGASCRIRPRPVRAVAGSARRPGTPRRPPGGTPLAGRGRRVQRIRAVPPTTCSPRCTVARLTPTCCCRGCSPSGASPGATQP